MSIYSKHYDVLLAQHITEKSSRCGQLGQHVFKVRADASKTDIKKAIEKAYNVEVSSCQVLNRKGKHRARRNGYTKASKIAYVTLKDKQQLNFAD